MKLIEISQQALTEAIESVNDTEYSTTDLVQLVEAHQSSNWSEPMSGEDFDAYIQRLVESRGKN